MTKLLFLLCMAVTVYLNVKVLFELKKKQGFCSPFMFFFMLMSIELSGPLIYYFVLNGTSYRRFADIQLICYWFIGVVAYTAILVVISPEKAKRRLMLSKRWRMVFNAWESSNFAHRCKTIGDKVKQIAGACKEKFGNFINKLLDLFRVNEKWFYAYIIAISAGVFAYLLIYGKDLLLVRILLGGDDLTRSDTSGLMPHWYTVSSFISFVIPSFYFFFAPKIKKSWMQFALFLGVGLLTMLDGNKGLFVYMILFLFVYVYRYRLNIWLVICGVVAVGLYFVIKAADITQLMAVVESMFRRFFVTQGTCFINRLELVSQGFDFSQSTRISSDVYTFMYGAKGGSAPTIFWGDIYVNHGPLVLLLVIVLTVVLLYRVSDYLNRNHHNNMVLYWSYGMSVYLLCMAELSMSHLLRILLLVGNAIAYVLTTTQRPAAENAKRINRRNKHG